MSGEPKPKACVKCYGLGRPDRPFGICKYCGAKSDIVIPIANEDEELTSPDLEMPDPPDEETNEVEDMTGVAFLEIEAIKVVNWHPTRDGSGPATQVHLCMRVKGYPNMLVMRFMSPRTIGRLITNLKKHKDLVWPPPA